MVEVKIGALDLLFAIAEKMERLSFHEGETIFPIGQEAHKMYFLVEGEVELSNEQGKLLARLHPGEFFGDESLFNDRPRAYKATSFGYTLLLNLSKTHLLAIISECPSVATELLYAYATSMDFRPRDH